MKTFFWIFPVVIVFGLLGCGTPEGGSDNSSSSEGGTDTGTVEDNAGTDDATSEEVSSGDNAVSLPKTVASLNAAAKNEAVDLSWSAVDGAASYTVYYALESMAGLSSLSEVVALADGRIIGSLSGVSSEVTGLTNGSEYFFTITAVNNVGESGRSAEVKATPAADNGSPQNLMAVAGNQSVELTWTEVENASSYNLYYATESFSTLSDVVNYASLETGTFVEGNVLTSTTVGGLVNDLPHFFVVTAIVSGIEGLISNEASATPKAAASGVTSASLNDTGIDFGIDFPDYATNSNATGNHNADCSGTFFELQDCSEGLDATNNDNEDGAVGFNYTKLDSLGSPLEKDAPFWNCVQDNVTGLVWEVKQGGNGFKADQGLHDIDDIFSWYNSNTAENGRDPGNDDTQSAACFGYTSDDENLCNTQAFVERVNSSKLCGLENWRMPTPSELLGLVHFGNSSPSIDTEYFPSVASGAKFWTNGTDPENTESHKAWVVLFDVKNAATLTSGSLLLSESKVAGRSVHLVSGE